MPSEQPSSISLSLSHTHTRTTHKQWDAIQSDPHFLALSAAAREALTHKHDAYKESALKMIFDSMPPSTWRQVESR